MASLNVNCAQVAFDVDGVNGQREITTLQRQMDYDTPQILSPLGAGTRDPIVPAPQWGEREFNHRLLNDWAEQFSLGLCVACMIVTVCILGAIIHTRNHPDVRSLSVGTMIATQIGCLFPLALPLVWQLQHNDAMCKARMFLLCVAYPCMINFVLVNTYRVARIFAKRKLQTEVFRTWKVVAYGLLSAVPFLVLFVAWTSAAPLTATVTVVDEARPAFNYVECSSSDSTGWFAALLSLIAINMLVVAYVANMVRVASARFQSSTQIAVALFTTILLLVVSNSRDPLVAASQCVVAGDRAWSGCYV